METFYLKKFTHENIKMKPPFKIFKIQNQTYFSDNTSL